MTGAVVAIGGSEDKVGACAVLRAVLALAGDRPTVAVIAAASEIGPQRVAAYTNLFSRFGAAAVVDATPRDRLDADRNASLLERVDAADLVFLTGGSQVRLLDTVEGTALHERVLVASDRGAVVAGTSAGAGALPDVAIAGGSDLEPVVRRGLGLLHGITIDQHFTQRQRRPRLESAVATHPDLAGIGIDEDTAVVFGTSAVRVVGTGVATLVRDGRSSVVASAGGRMAVAA